MRNILNNIFIGFTLMASMLVGCNPKGGDLTALQDGQSDDATTQTLANLNLAKPNLLNDKQKLAQDTLEKAQGVESEKDKEKNKEKETLIAWITNKAQTDMALINKYNNNIEDSEQYGMKLGVFKFLNNTDNNKPIHFVENTRLRKQLYSSLDWSEDKIRKLGTILNTIGPNDGDHLAKTILSAGINYAQGYFEWIIDITYERKENLNKLTLRKLKNIKVNLEKIDKLRQKWINATNNIISDYEANTDDIQNNKQVLVKHVNSQYGTTFKHFIPNIQVLAQNIEKILK